MRKITLHITSFLYFVGDFFTFFVQSFTNTFKPPYRIKIIVQQLYIIGIGSIGIIALTSLGTGFILSLQLTTELYSFSAPRLSFNLIGHLLAREYAPIFTVFMIIAKNGSAMTAEIGTMKITEQLDALKTMSINPMQYLVGPRLIACIVMFPVLAAFSNLVGLIGAALIMFGLLELDYAFAVNYMLQRLAPEEITFGLIKSLLLGIMVCIICCYFGFRSENSSQGVGKATTRAVVLSCVATLMVDFLIGKIFIDLGVIQY